MLKTREDAEEAVADVFFNLWKYRHTIIIEKNVKSYLFISVRNACLSRLKKVSLAQEGLEAVENSIHFSQHPDAEPLPDPLEEVTQALKILPPRCRQIFILSKLEGMKYREISNVLQIAEKTVENQLVKALSLLRKHMATRFRVPARLHAEDTDT